MKKLLIFHPYLAPYRVDLYNHLAQLFNLRVLLTGSKHEKNTLGFDLELVNRQAQFTFYYVEGKLYFGRHLLSNAYWKQIRSFHPDVVIAHELGVNTLVAIFLKRFFRYKLLVTVDDSPAMIREYGIIRKLLQRFVIKYSEAILVLNPEVKYYLENEYKLQNTCRFIYLPIIQNDEVLRLKLRDVEKEVWKLLADYSLNNKKIILFVGRLIPNKCPDMLLRAFHKLNENNSILVFVGEGSMKVDLNNYVRKNQLGKKVIFTGHLSGSALYAWYRLADVFVLPSKFEPFGAVVNEALVAGCRVVVSERVGANCLINDQNGIIFKGDNDLNLLDAINRCLNVPQQLPKGYIRLNNMPISFETILNQFDTLFQDED